MNESEADGILGIRVKSAKNKVAAIKHIREATNLSLVEIKTALANQSTILVAQLFRIDHEEWEAKSKALFESLELAGVEFEILLDGEPESKQYFENAMQQWRDIGDQTEYMTDLESGNPSIETLEWLQSNGTPDAFRQTLRQIIDGDGYSVDLPTMEWAIRMFRES